MTDDLWCVSCEGEGRTFGPVPAASLRQWAREGGVRPTDPVWPADAPASAAPASAWPFLFSAADDPEAGWYWVRDGQTYGPEYKRHLRILAANGQLAPEDLVARAGDADWRRAEEVEELFPAPATRPPAQVDRPTVMSETTWYYATNGRTFGPTTFEHLRQLAAAGDLTPDTPVWRGGDSSWVRAADVPGLILPPPPPGLILPPPPPSDSSATAWPVSPGPKPSLLDSFRERVVSADNLLQFTSGWSLVMVVAGFLCGTCGFCFSGCGRDSSSGPSGPTPPDPPPDHLPVRVEVYPRSGSRPVMTVINATTDRALLDVTVSLTSAKGIPAAEVRPGGGRRLGPGERVGLSADDFGGRVPVNGDVVRVWAANEKDPPLVFTVRFLANQVK